MEEVAFVGVFPAVVVWAGELDSVFCVVSVVSVPPVAALSPETSELESAEPALSVEEGVTGFLPQAAMEAHKIAASRQANVLFILLRPFYILSIIDGFRAWIHLLPFHTRPLPAPCRT